MRILVIVGQTTLLASLFIMLGFEFSLPVKGIPSAFILLCFAIISFLTGIIGLIVGVIVTIFFQYNDQLIKLLENIEKITNIKFGDIAASSPYDLHPGLIGLLVNLAIVFFVSIYQEQSEEELLHAAKFIDE